ncbi:MULTISPECIES: hypothetical protein [Stenotrophomonas]|jgi:hypothetical protein|uniref:Transmembrane protein n=1 Tax=Stenotrophomonas maltophilia TaxID=40324 RepID=A0A4S2D7C6_STEMA|nr:MULTISPECIES: hypothetical protein [Stenotrophomonas]MBD3825795.1 hypothetical protein [Stenotrophomonas sp.]QIO88908.1 hypothetical protein G9274_002593 [Stenotrophomonas rhizophila]TGY36404.1 hypothetical protein E5352_02595 [Stenotrophomonas maltophilia]HBS61896.1 hypothetical protein [Stenotrophomonas sp.]
MWPRAFAALLAGFLVAAAATGLVAWLPPGPWERAVVPSLIAFVPLWMLAAVWAFSFRTGLRAWTGMGVAAALGFALLWLLRSTQWVQ